MSLIAFCNKEACTINSRHVTLRASFVNCYASLATNVDLSSSSDSIHITLKEILMLQPIDIDYACRLWSLSSLVVSRLESGVRSPLRTRIFSHARPDRPSDPPRFLYGRWRSGVRLNPLGTPAISWSVIPVPVDRWLWVWSSRWNKNWQGKPKCSEKTCSSATLSTTNPT
jgi:hypothetical protein